MSKFSQINSDQLFSSINDRIAVDTTESTASIRWKPTLKGKEGYAIIRFLPGLEGDVAYYKAYQHVIKNGNKWFVETCPTTVGEKCPICEHNKVLWNQGEEDLVRSRKRSLKYTSNVLVVNDPAVPSNNGKVFLYQYSDSIFNMIKTAMNPVFPGEKAFNPFDVFNGANLILKMMTVNNFRNYDKSVFEAPSVVYSDATMLDALYSSQHNIMEQFKISSFDELSKKYNAFLGLKTAQAVTKIEELSDIEMPF